MKKILSIICIIALIAITTVSAQDEPVYMGYASFGDQFCESSNMVVQYSGCEYYCSWCTGSNYICDAFGSCC